MGNTEKNEIVNEAKENILDGTLHTQIHKIFKLEEFLEALEYVRREKFRGKLLLN